MPSAAAPDITGHRRPRGNRGEQPGAAAVTVDTVEVAGTKLAEWLSIAQPVVSKLSTEGILPRTDAGRYPLRDAVRGYVIWLRDQYKRNTKGALADRIQEAKAAEIELKTAMRSGEVIELSEALDRFALWAGAIKSDLMGLAVRLSDNPKQRQQIEAEVNELLARWTAVAERAGAEEEAEDTE